MTHTDDLRLQGRVPEFTRMSLKPGIGADFMHDVASTLLDHDLAQGDVPVTLRHGSKEYPLGRYLRRKLRAAVGKDEACPDEAFKKMEAELQPLREAAFNNSRSFKKEVVDAGNNRVRKIETRNKIFKRSKTL